MSNSQFDPNQGQPYTNPTRKQAQEAPQGAARSDEQGLSGVTHTGGGSSPVTDVQWNRMSWHQRQAYLATLDRARRALETQIVVHRPRTAPLPPDPNGLAHWDALAAAIGARGEPHPHEQPQHPGYPPTKPWRLHGPDGYVASYATETAAHARADTLGWHWSDYRVTNAAAPHAEGDAA